METFSALLALCAGNSPVPDEFHAQRPETRSFDVFCAWINDWANNREAGDLRSYHAHYDVSVISYLVIFIDINVMLVMFHMRIAAPYPILRNSMMTSSNGNIFRVTGPLCGEFTGPGEFPTQRPETRSFDVFFDLRLNKRLSKQPWGWWFETPSWSLWRQSNAF